MHENTDPILKIFAESHLIDSTTKETAGQLKLDPAQEWTKSLLPSWAFVR